MLPAGDAAKSVEREKNKMIQSYTLLGMLGICAWEDYRRKRVLVYPVLAFAIAGLVLHLCYMDITIFNMLAGIAIGCILLLVSRITGGRIGIGDGMILIVSGIYLGFTENIRLFFHGLLLCGIWSLFLLVIRKRKRDEEIAFVPFLFLAYLEMLLFQG